MDKKLDKYGRSEILGKERGYYKYMDLTDPSSALHTVIVINTGFGHEEMLFTILKDK